MIHPFANQLTKLEERVSKLEKKLISNLSDKFVARMFLKIASSEMKVTQLVQLTDIQQKIVEILAEERGILLTDEPEPEEQEASA